jgi:hypothetical protein
MMAPGSAASRPSRDRAAAETLNGSVLPELLGQVAGGTDTDPRQATNLAQKRATGAV